MITDTTYKKLKKYADERAIPDIELAEAMRIFCSDLIGIYKDPEKNITKTEATILLTVASSLENIFANARKNVQNHANKTVKSKVRIASTMEGLKSVFWGVVSNIIFVIFSIMALFAMRSTATDYLDKLNTNDIPKSELELPLNSTTNEIDESEQK